MAQSLLNANMAGDLAGAAVGQALIPIPGVGGAVGGSLASVIGGDANKDTERAQVIQQLAQQGNVAELMEWATGSGGNGTRSNEPDASRIIAAQVLGQMGFSVTPMGSNGQALNPATLSASQQGALSTMGSALGLVAGSMGGGGGGGNPLATLAGAATTGLGLAAANKESNQAQHEYNLANQNAEQQYNATAGLRAQGINQLQNAVSQQPNLSAMFAAPSNPFARSAPVSGTPLPAVTNNATGAASTNPVGVNTAATPNGQPLPAVSK